jgi:16S rRNA (cytidine1402-2'-O)-methyltransferase
VPRSRTDPSGGPVRSKLAGGLYIVATPIGNLGDITRRAAETLQQVDVIASEDTRVTRRLLTALGIPAPRLLRYDDHADDNDREQVLALVRGGKAVALVSDAGMPLIADPGHKLVRAAQNAGLRVTAVPGASAALAAIAVSGLPSDRFLFAGFLPPKDGPRHRALAELAAVKATLVFFEAPQRLADTLQAMADTLGAREVVVARELTKLFEETRRGTLAELAQAYATAEAPKGEIVIVVAPPAEGAVIADDTFDARLTAALARASVRDAVAEIAATTGRSRGDVYARALELKKSSG